MGNTLQERFRGLAEACFLESLRVKEDLLRTQMTAVLDMADVVVRAFRDGNRLFLFGNGGSASDAQHLAAEFVNRFQRERPPLPAIALTVDTSILTSISNDFHFDDVFLKQLRALARPGDVALGISTSGRSPNVLKALRWACENGLHTLGWTGTGLSGMDDCCDLMLHVPSKVTARIQECHITVGHTLCAVVDEALFGGEDCQ
ncbi:MAG: D-sedoheptulose 7-phosphate isomerase [Syntrophobacteraceae bacterium]|nr:D-sedoheptulose 7-phosphate isomerase [Desulfobacteraceae bacterium]